MYDFQNGPSPSLKPTLERHAAYKPGFSGNAPIGGPYPANEALAYIEWLERQLHARMKLYVIGEKSSNPDDWSPWSEWTLVLAESPEAALALANGYGRDPVTKVPTDKPLILASEHEPNWGDDL